MHSPGSATVPVNLKIEFILLFSSISENKELGIWSIRRHKKKVSNSDEMMSVIPT